MIYPAISSTASRGGFKLIYARSFRPNLAFECIKRASLMERDERQTFLSQLSRYPGLSATVDKNYWFLAGQRRRATESEVKTIDGESAKSVVESSSDDVDDEEEVEISMPGGDFKSKNSMSDAKLRASTKSKTAARENSNDSSSSDSDYDLFRGDFGSPKKKRLRRTSKSTKGSKSDCSDSSDFFEPNSPAVPKRQPTGATAKSARKKFRLRSQKK